MKYNYPLCLFAILCFLSKTLLAQNELKLDIISPSPNSASLGKYGNIPVSHYTGTYNLTIPIYKYAGYNTFKEIWRAPGSFQKVGNFIEKRLSDGRGIRLQENWKFKGFLD